MHYKNQNKEVLMKKVLTENLMLAGTFIMLQGMAIYATALYSNSQDKGPIDASVFMVCGILISLLLLAMIILIRDYAIESANSKQLRLFNDALNEHLLSKSLPEIDIESQLRFLSEEPVLVLDRVRYGLWDTQGLIEKRTPVSNSVRLTTS